MLRDSDTHYISDHSSLMEVAPPEFQSQVKGLCFLYKKDEETGHATIYTSTHIMGFFMEVIMHADYFGFLTGVEVTPPEFRNRKITTSSFVGHD